MAIHAWNSSAVAEKVSDILEKHIRSPVLAHCSPYKLTFIHSLSNHRTVSLVCSPECQKPPVLHNITS